MADKITFTKEEREAIKAFDPEITKQELYDYIKQVYGLDHISSKIDSEVARYKMNEGMIYKDIKRCIQYCDEVLHKKYTEQDLWEVGILNQLDYHFRAREYYNRLDKFELDRIIRGAKRFGLL